MKKDNIEEIYNELEAFSKVPPKELWDNIEERLHSKKKKRGVLFFWGSVAALFVIFVGYVFTNSQDSIREPINEITDIELPKGDDSINASNDKTTKIVEGIDIRSINEDSLMEKPSNVKELLNNIASKKQLSDRKERLKKKEKGNYITKNSYEDKESKEKKSKYNNRYAQSIEKAKDNEINKNDILTLQKKNESIAKNKKGEWITSNDSTFHAEEVPLFDLEEKRIVKNENVGDSTITNRVSSLKWSVEVLAGLSNTTSDASIQGAPVNTTSQGNFVYTLKVGYSISNRLVVKSGIGKNVLGQEINNIRYGSSDTPLSEDISQNIVNNQNILFFNSPESFNAISSFAGTINEGDLRQQFDYIQVPLEFSYNLLGEKKYNVALGIGGNVNFLTNNRAYLGNEEIGESIGVNATIFGASLNSNISYEIAKKTILFIEPSYNYFQRPIDNNNQTFKNTQLRVLFGLQYKL